MRIDRLFKLEKIRPKMLLWALERLLSWNKLRKENASILEEGMWVRLKFRKF